MLRLLNDRGLVSTLKKTMESTALHGESVLAEEITLLRDKASGSTDELTIKNLITMQDLYYRILYNMLPSDENRISSLLKIPAGSILVANRLAPVEVAVVPIGNVVGILIEESTQYSHSSILARTLGVPVIIDFPGYRIAARRIDRRDDRRVQRYCFSQSFRSNDQGMLRRRKPV
jgi:phosphotransferase system enzyme I (PtsI)